MPERAFVTPVLRPNHSTSIRPQPIPRNFPVGYCREPPALRLPNESPAPFSASGGTGWAAFGGVWGFTRCGCGVLPPERCVGAGATCVGVVAFFVEVGARCVRTVARCVGAVVTCVRTGTTFVGVVASCVRAGATFVESMFFFVEAVATCVKVVATSDRAVAGFVFPATPVFPYLRNR
jgi:hypothetical protein